MEQRAPRERRQDLPVFPLPVNECHVLNSSPYVMSLHDFTAMFEGDEARTWILRSLKRTLREVSDANASPFAMLVGGSFIRHSVSDPKDLDGIIFYTASEDPLVAQRLLRIREAARDNGLDLRFIPD